MQEFSRKQLEMVIEKEEVDKVFSILPPNVDKINDDNLKKALDKMDEESRNEYLNHFVKIEMAIRKKKKYYVICNILSAFMFIDFICFLIFGALTRNQTKDMKYYITASVFAIVLLFISALYKYIHKNHLEKKASISKDNK